MEYLTRTLGFRVMYMDGDVPSMPNYINSRYRVQKVSLDGKKAAFVYPKGDLDTVNALEKHMDRMIKTMDVPAVLILNHLEYRQRNYLIKSHIPFIVEGKQIYLPFMAIYLQERCDCERRAPKTILPSAQVLFLYYIYNGCKRLQTSDAAKALSLTATSISRASRQLEELGLLKTEKHGVQKILRSDMEAKELFESAQSKLMNPVKRTIYLPKEKINKDLLMSGYSALADYSMLNPGVIHYFATGSISEWEKDSSSKLQNADDQYAVELWRYDPRILSDGTCVDRLSLALALRDEKDERVEEAIEDMLDNLWRDINGKRN